MLFFYIVKKILTTAFELYNIDVVLRLKGTIICVWSLNFKYIF